MAGITEINFQPAFPPQHNDHEPNVIITANPLAKDIVLPVFTGQVTYAIIRGNNGRRHKVDFGDSPVRVEVYASEETVEIFVEADSETLPEERRRFALINVPRDQFSHATGEAARRATRKGRYRRTTSA